MSTSFAGRLGTAPEEAVKAPCVVAATTNITLSGTQTIDTVAVVAGDRVLVAGQTDATENGIYDAAASAWSRATDWNDAQDVVTGQLVSVPTAIYEASFTGDFAPGTTSVSFTLIQYSRVSRVTVLPPTDNASNVIKPDGTFLNIDGSTTSGTQEAIDFACGDGTAGNGDYDLFIAGAEETGPTFQAGGPVVYQCTTPIVFPPMQGKKISSGAFTWNFSSAIGTDTCVTIDSCMLVDFDMAGMQVSNQGTGISLLFAPTNAVPLDDITTIIDSRFFFTAVANSSNSVQADSLGAIVRFSFPDAASTIVNNHFQFGEINQQNTGSSTNCIWVDNPGASGAFANNTIICPHVHNFSAEGLQIGTSSDIASRGGNNTWRLVLGAHANGGDAAISTFGDEDQFHCSHETNTVTNAVILQTSAARNTFYGNALTSISATFVNGATDKTSNKWIRSAPNVGSTSISPTGSPFDYQNITLLEEMVIVDGGTVSAIAISHDDTTYRDVGVTAGMFRLPQGFYLRVTYSGPPTMWSFEV